MILLDLSLASSAQTGEEMPHRGSRKGEAPETLSPETEASLPCCGCPLEIHPTSWSPLAYFVIHDSKNQFLEILEKFKIIWKL